MSALAIIRYSFARRTISMVRVGTSFDIELGLFGPGLSLEI